MALIDELVGGGVLECAEHEWLRRQLLRFGSVEARREWLSMPHVGLEGRKPIDVLSWDAARVATVMGGRRYYPAVPLSEEGGP